MYQCIYVYMFVFYLPTIIKKGLVKSLNDKNNYAYDVKHTKYILLVY